MEIIEKEFKDLEKDLKQMLREESERVKNSKGEENTKQNLWVNKKTGKVKDFTTNDPIELKASDLKQMSDREKILDIVCPSSIILVSAVYTLESDVSKNIKKKILKYEMIPFSYENFWVF